MGAMEEEGAHDLAEGPALEVKSLNRPVRTSRR